MNLLELEEGKYYMEPNRTFFKRWRGDIWNSTDAVNWRRSFEVLNFDQLRSLTFSEVRLAVSYDVLNAAKAPAAPENPGQEATSAPKDDAKPEAAPEAPAAPEANTEAPVASAPQSPN